MKLFILAALFTTSLPASVEFQYLILDEIGFTVGSEAAQWDNRRPDTAIRATEAQFSEYTVVRAYCFVRGVYSTFLPGQESDVRVFISETHSMLFDDNELQRGESGEAPAFLAPANDSVILRPFRGSSADAVVVRLRAEDKIEISEDIKEFVREVAKEAENTFEALEVVEAISSVSQRLLSRNTLSRSYNKLQRRVANDIFGRTRGLLRDKLDRVIQMKMVSARSSADRIALEEFRAEILEKLAEN